MGWRKSFVSGEKYAFGRSLSASSLARELAHTSTGKKVLHLSTRKDMWRDMCKCSCLTSNEMKAASPFFLKVLYVQFCAISHENCTDFVFSTLPAFCRIQDCLANKSA